KRRTAVTLLGATMLCGAPAWAQETGRGSNLVLSGISIGSPIATVVKALGMPSEVSSMDAGHFWSWRPPHAGLEVVTDDDAVVRVVDETPLDDTETVTLTVDGKPVRVHLRDYTVSMADAQLNDVVAFSSQKTRVYALTPTRQLVLMFADGNTLSR